MDFSEVAPTEPVVEEKAPPPPRAKIEPDVGGGSSFADMLQKRAARSAAANLGVFEKKDSEAEIQWKKAAENLEKRPLIINDLDFSQFHGAEYQQDPLQLARMAKMAESNNGRGGVSGAGVPPPPPPPTSIPLPPRCEFLDKIMKSKKDFFSKLFQKLLNLCKSSFWQINEMFLKLCPILYVKKKNRCRVINGFTSTNEFYMEKSWKF